MVSLQPVPGESSGANWAIVLKGQTATGKSAMALRLAQRFPLRLISVDSAQVFRGMDIGTAKPSARVLRTFPHDLIDIRNPTETYSAGDFRRDALESMTAALQAGRIPLLVGGTLLYFQALLKGLSGLPSADQALRRGLDARAHEAGFATPREWLEAIDPEAAARIDPADRQRLERALEVYLLTGRPLAEHWHGASTEPAPGWRFLTLIVVEPDRARLARRIADRVDRMLEAGLVAEVQNILEQFPGAGDAPPLRAVGYRQVLQYLNAEMGRAELAQRITTATRQFAKRQMTWLRGEPTGHWLSSGQIDKLESRVETLVRDVMPRNLGDRVIQVR
ncbi:MAG: tRNA (adenosine(37)-N6)-dimethylallyltransferase MiaA [Pseudomonadota bacterium]|nr:tRNA (adenosine(37)-N6)-dimethylallyltransferase MiaA [Pseudomonadota bacterium]